MEEEKQEKKIVVDEDWKTQVQAEKEAAKQEKQASTAEDVEAEEASASEAASAVQDMEMPPASFPLLVTTFATQTLTALGHIPDPVEGKQVVRPGVARHFIDTLGVLEEKTRGNLSPEEEQMLSGTLHQLRMAFVAAQSSDTVEDGG